MEENTMRSELIEKVTGVEAGTRFDAQVQRMEEAVVDAVEGVVRATKRAAKKGRRATEDLVDDAEYQVKQHPLATVGICLGLGLGVGAVIGAVLGRSGHFASR